MAVSNNAVVPGARLSLRAARYAAITATGFAAAVSLLSAPAADAAGPVARPTAAASVVRALTASGPGPTAEIPADFRAFAGYTPALVDGTLVAPHGSCSSPVPLPAEFESACKAHDLGYDLLRYAGSTGAPLGPWARQELDRSLAERMHATCVQRPEPLPRVRCTAMAEVAATAVDLNSMRQDYGIPVAEDFPLAGTVTAWLPRICALLLAALVLMMLRRPGAVPLLPRARTDRRLFSYPTATGGSHV